jgi:hypothetical protein
MQDPLMAQGSRKEHVELRIYPSTSSFSSLDLPEFLNTSSY